jgi:hypothetical protein
LEKGYLQVFAEGIKLRTFILNFQLYPQGHPFYSPKKDLTLTEEKRCEQGGRD